jgi:hypothetical protein
MVRALEKAITEVGTILKEVTRVNPEGVRPVRFKIGVTVELENGTEIVCVPTGTIP